ncbi:MAG: ATP-dependent helicase HrpB, partial [Frankiaceae bacterium]|nr:ATP-dependent helicase HrpB [Frankiaceae bacterium]
MLPPDGTPGTDLPVRTALPALQKALDDGGTAVLVAPPGTGKTTLVPLALAGQVAGRVLVAEPRRIAARAAARRMADLLGEPVGQQVGFSVRGESRTSAATRIEVVTTGLLVQRLQRDPELPGVAAILLDECHERHLDTDLALAFAADTRAVLRPDLLLVAASAMAQSSRIAAALGQDGRAAPVIEATDALFDVDIVWRPPETPLPPPHGLHVDRRLLDHVAAVVRRAAADTSGDVLVFLPGTGEISSVAGQLQGLAGELGCDVLPLHGRLPPREQDRALTPGPGRRIVLATAVAESSLTVPGVRTVVDAGLARVPRTDLARGLDALLTVAESRASATQRAGRAGREAPGRAYRCWSAATHDRLPAFAEPEVATADLTAFALQLACWGAPGGTGLALLDVPPAAALEVAHDTLHALGAVDDQGRATPWGRTLLTVGAHPRLANALLEATGRLGARPAAEVVALLSEPAGTGAGDDLVGQLRAARRAPGAGWQAEVRRLERAAGSHSGSPRRVSRRAVTDDVAAGLVVGSAFPERLARRRDRPAGSDEADATRSPVYLMANGTGAELAPGSSLRGADWLAIAVADRQPGRRDARVRSAVAIDEPTARELGRSLLRTDRSVGWRDGDVRAERVERLGAIVLSTRPLPEPDAAAVWDALLDGLRAEGLAL